MDHTIHSGYCGKAILKLTAKPGAGCRLRSQFDLDSRSADV